MKCYELTVTETAKVTLTIEADNGKDAIERFEKWLSKNSNEEYVIHQLDRSFSGWEYSVHQRHDKVKPDITYEETSSL